MLKDVTLGQFFPGNSILHKLDPRMKILLSVLYIVAIFCAQEASAFLLLAVSALFLIFVSHLKELLTVHIRHLFTVHGGIEIQSKEALDFFFLQPVGFKSLFSNSLLNAIC